MEAIDGEQRVGTVGYLLLLLLRITFYILRENIMHSFLIALIITFSTGLISAAIADDTGPEFSSYTKQNNLAYTFNSLTAPKALSVMLLKKMQLPPTSSPCFNFVCKGELCTAYVITYDGC